MAKAGRKRKQSIRRQPNGQPYRGNDEKPVDTVVAVRMRMYGLTKQNAGTELAGYEIGRMALRGVFGAEYQPAVDAVYEYVTAAADYLRIKSPMHPIPKAMDYLAGRGASLAPEPSLKSVQRIEEKYDRLLAKLNRADPQDRIIFHEIAFHDRNHGMRGENAVKSCVEALARG